jgi:aconitase B
VYCFSTASATFDLLLRVDNTDRGFWRTNAPAFHQFCEWLRTPTPYQAQTVPRCVALQLNVDDLRLAAGILKGRKVNPGLRCIILPGSQQVYLDALAEGLIETFVRAGAVVSTPTCGPCLGGHMGIIAAGERAVSTTNRNFIGRMGSPKSFVYLSNPAVAAASAITGRITHPDFI